MPDLKSEIQTKLANLKFDDGDEEAETQGTNDEPNMTHRVFMFFRSNPMSTMRECMESLGLTESQASTRASQLFTRKALTRSKVGDGPFRYTAAIDALPSREEAVRAALIKAHAARKTKAARRRNAEAARAAKAAKAAKRESESQTVAITPEAIDELLTQLNVVQARELLNKLKALFGETA